jgi:hypothetical protein
MSLTRLPKSQRQPMKFDLNEVQYDTVDSKVVVREITLGGTKTRLIFN